MVRYCSNCGSEIPDNGLFCPKCGKEAVNLNDVNRRNPMAEVEKPKNESKRFSFKRIIIILIIIYLIVCSIYALASFNDSQDIVSDEKFNITYKGIYISGKGEISKSTEPMNETSFEGVPFDHLDYYDVSLNNGEEYSLVVAEMKMDNISDIPSDNFTNLDTGNNYSLPFAKIYSDSHESEGGKNITYVYGILLYNPSHYKYASTEFLDSIIYHEDN